MSKLSSEAKILIARLYVENGGKELKSLPRWITNHDAQEYVQHLRDDEMQHAYPDREIDRIVQQDIVSRREKGK